MYGGTGTSLEGGGLPGKYIDIIKDMYSGTETSVRAPVGDADVTAQRNRTIILSALSASTPSAHAPRGFKTRHDSEGIKPLLRKSLFPFTTNMSPA
ncbi:hypothetical protein Hanom_Chr01g00073231 [Helianthus anomalus]